MTTDRIQIVDENDTVIGSKERHDVDAVRDIYRITGLWVTNSKGEVLIAQRKFTKSHDPGKWGPAVAGTVDEGETYEENMRKEAEEELGIKDVEFSLGPKKRRHVPWNYFCQWFTVTLDWELEDFKIQEAEVEQIAWIPADELARDMAEHPDKYIPSMDDAIKTFI